MGFELGYNGVKMGVKEAFDLIFDFLRPKDASLDGKEPTVRVGLWLTVRYTAVGVNSALQCGWG